MPLSEIGNIGRRPYFKRQLGFGHGEFEMPLRHPGEGKIRQLEI